MDEENQRGHGVRVPLHPRQAQALFFELVQVPPVPRTVQQPQPPSPRSFQQRVAHTQHFSTDALTQLQRGHWVRSLASPCPGDPLVRLRLSHDGSRLELHAFVSDAKEKERETDDAAAAMTCLASLDVASIQSLALFPHARFAVHADAATHGDKGGSLFQSLLEAESDAVLTRIAIAVVSSVSAQRDTMTHSKQSTASLLWQAVRLRVVELTAAGMALRDAVAVLEAAYGVITTRESQSELPVLTDLFLLRCA